MAGLDKTVTEDDRDERCEIEREYGKAGEQRFQIIPNLHGSLTRARLECRFR